MLLVFRHDTECERQKQADHAEFMFMLNDFGGIYIDTRREQSQVELNEHDELLVYKHDKCQCALFPPILCHVLLSSILIHYTSCFPYM